MTSLSGSETNRNRATRKEEGIEYWLGASAPKTPGIYRLQPECLDKHNRTDHLLTKPDILTCYGQPSEQLRSGLRVLRSTLRIFSGSSRVWENRAPPVLPDVANPRLLTRDRHWWISVILLN